MNTVAVLGASGFVGSTVVSALRLRGAEVRAVVAPRLTSTARSHTDLVLNLASCEARVAIDRLREQLLGCDAVVNAAGVAVATASGDALFGADALLPGVVARAMPLGARLVHVSSAAVQGRREVLDETTATDPFSPYSRAKTLGEELAQSEHRRVVCFRPTSVHGQGRPVTTTLVRVLSSRIASVAGTGNRPTPQVLVENVGDAAAHLALSEEEPPLVVLQPTEGLTTADLVRVVGGRPPIHVPTKLAAGLVAFAFALGRQSSRAAGIARRVEMLWFGQRQRTGWLDTRWSAPVGREGWADLT